MAVNGSCWFGAAVDAAGSLLLLSGKLVSVDIGWRIGFGIGGVLGLFVILLRRFVPESPRWLITHGRERQAKDTLRDVEEEVGSREGGHLPAAGGKRLTVHPRPHFGLPILRTMFGKFRACSVLALTLMTAQAFLFNAVFFTYGLVLARFYHVRNTRAGLDILPLAAGNFLGPVLLSPLFDTIGRRRMIVGTFGLTSRGW